MKIGVMSDTHGSLDYFEKAIKTLSDCDVLLHGGDILYHGPRNDLPKGYNPKAVVEKLNGLENILITKGNCESDVERPDHCRCRSIHGRCRRSRCRRAGPRAGYCLRRPVCRIRTGLPHYAVGR